MYKILRALLSDPVCLFLLSLLVTVVCLLFVAFGLCLSLYCLSLLFVSIVCQRLGFMDFVQHLKQGCIAIRCQAPHQECRSARPQTFTAVGVLLQARRQGYRGAVRRIPLRSCRGAGVHVQPCSPWKITMLGFSYHRPNAQV